MEFAAHQTMHQQTHKQKQKLQQAQASKIKQEPRNQSQLLATNQSPFHPTAAGRVVGTRSPNNMMSVMKHNMNMNISSPPMMSDSSIDSVGSGGNTMSTMTNTSIKAMMGQSMCLKSSSNANALNQNLGNNVLSTGMGQNGPNMINNIDMSMTANPNSCTGDDSNKLLQQQQQQILRNKAMNMSGAGARPPPPEYEGNSMMTNQMIQQSNGNQFSKVAPPPPPNMRHMPPSGMFYK